MLIDLIFHHLAGGQTGGPNVLSFGIGVGPTDVIKCANRQLYHFRGFCSREWRNSPFPIDWTNGSYHCSTAVLAVKMHIGH